MSTKQTAAREADETAQQRAQTDQFAFDVDVLDSYKSPTRATRTPQPTSTPSTSTSSTVRHELIHAWQYHEFGEADHGAMFTRWTDDLDTSRYCERFTTPKWWLVCEDCDGRVVRYRRSKTVPNPEQYSCSQCGGAIRVEEANRL